MSQFLKITVCYFLRDIFILEFCKLSFELKINSNFSFGFLSSVHNYINKG